MQPTDLTARQRMQDEEYGFPYHYLADCRDGKFANGRLLDWGHEYLSYLTYVADVLADFSWASLLDVGCGDGRLVRLLSERFPDRQVTGIDYSERAIALAKGMSPKCAFVVGDITAEPETQSDCATCVDVLEHIEPGFLPRFVGGIRAHVRHGGSLLVTVPSANRPVTKKHYQHFTPESLRAVLEPAFKVTEFRYLNASSPALTLLTKLLVNRFYAVTAPALLSAYYRHYRTRYLISDERRGGRLVAICEAP